MKLRPPRQREAELTHDYARMETMFLAKPPAFSEVVRVLSEAERHINGA
jgi:hypothetical protein